MTLDNIYQIFEKYSRISIDSRNVTADSLFFALRGENFDANQFAAEALKNGAAYAVVDNPAVALDERFILVSDVLLCLQGMATLHRRKFQLPVIAITGSNGKTTTKELMAAVLRQKFNTLATSGNLNNHIGVPLTLLQLTQEHEIAVVEMGANHIGEIEQLCRIAEPTYGLITNIGRAHLEGFGGVQGVIKAKTELYKHIADTRGKVFVNAGDDLLMSHAAAISKVTYGIGTVADYEGDILADQPFMRLKCTEQCSSFELNSQLTGRYNAANILAAACVGRYFGVTVEAITKAIQEYVPGNNRSQIINTSNNLVILDAYNANPSSMAAAIDNFIAFGGKEKVCILGDMLELGVYSAEEHLNLLQKVTDAGFEKCMLVGDQFGAHRDKFEQHFFFGKNSDAAAWLSEKKLSGKTILVKGSRGIKLEEILPAL